MQNSVIAVWHRYFYRTTGSVAIEFSMVFIPFIISILFIAELCRVVYLSSALDLMLAESGHVASITTSPEKYNTYFTEELNKRMTRWPLISRPAVVSVSILYCDNLSYLATEQNRCSTTISVDKPLALYQLTVNYQPLFFIFPRTMTERELKRRVVFVQEFQRPVLEDDNA